MLLSIRLQCDFYYKKIFCQITKSLLKGNKRLDITEESAAKSVYYKQNKKKITEKREDDFNNITEFSTFNDQTGITGISQLSLSF